MSKINFIQYSNWCSKLTFSRLSIILGLFLLTYLFIYVIDIRSTASAVRTVIVPFIENDQTDPQASKSLPVIATAATAATTAVATAAAPGTTVTTTISTTVTITSSSAKVELYTSTNSNLTNESSTTQNANNSYQPKEAFVTFSNNDPNYLSLLQVFLDSVHTFSTRPVIAFGIDVDLNIDLVKYPRVIKRRIRQSDCGPSVYFCKIHAIVSSNVDYGVLMETDDVVNYNVDILFEVLRVWPYPYPLSPRHPDDPRNYEHFMRQHNVSKRTTPYIHAHIIWNYHALPFLKNVHELLRAGHFQGSNFDETAVNVMLWKAGANHTLCKYDPFFTYSEAYEKFPVILNCSQYCHTVFVTLHGSKEYKTSSELFIRLKANAGKPALQTLGMGGMKHINDTSVTCCYPDSKPSPIHPLLCEHPPSA